LHVLVEGRCDLVAGIRFSLGQGIRKRMSGPAHGAGLSHGRAAVPRKRPALTHGQLGANSGHQFAAHPNR
jgi:hypothetical protein